MGDSELAFNIGDTCKVVNGIYQGIIVKIIDLPDKSDARYSVSRDGFAGLRFHSEDLELVEASREAGQ